jgi:hypothetical protein
MARSIVLRRKEAAQYVGSNDSVMVCERVEAVETELNRTPRRKLQKARSMMIVRRRVDEMAENLLFAP